MRFRTALFAALPTLLIALPFTAHATGIPFFGPIVPPGASECAGSWAALADLFNRAVAFLVTIVLLFVTPFMIAWAGFLYVFSPTNPGMRSRANAILLNTLIGVIFALAAWLIVNTLLTALTSKGVNDFTANIFRAGSPCLPIATKLNPAKGSSATGGSTDGSGSTGDGGLDIGDGDLGTGDDGISSIDGSADGPTCPDGTSQNGSSCQSCDTNGSCEFVQPTGSSCPDGTFDQGSGKCETCSVGGGCDQTDPVVPKGDGGGPFGVSGQQCASDNAACSPAALQAAGLTQAQSNVLSCLAVTESTGNPNVADNPDSGACGTFQFVPGTLASIQRKVSSCSNCNSAQCGIQGAAYLVRNRINIGQSPYGDWTCSGCNSKAAACVAQYDPGS